MMVNNNVDSCESGDLPDGLVEQELLAEYIKECQTKFQSKAELRAQNDCQDYTEAEEDLQGLDCGVKKNCAFVKKLRNMTEGQKESLIKDMLSLNLSKYISEVAGALVEAKLKMSDIPMAIKICSLLHQRYSDFSAQLLDAWNKSLPKKPSDLANLNLSKMRIDIRFFAELITSGIFTLKEGLPILGNLLTLLVTSDKENHNNINIILTFCRHCGDNYAGLTPRKMRLLSDKYGIPLIKSDFLPSDRQRGLRNLLKDYYKSLASHITRDHKALQSLERQNRRTLISKGELSEKRKEKFEQAQIAFQKLWSATQQMADILDEDLPELPPDSPDSFDDMDESTINLDITNRFKTNQEYDPSALWEDEDTRSFYEDIPDLKSLVPSILYKDSAKDGIKDRKEAAVQDKISKDDEGRAEDAATPVVGLMETVIEENEEETLTMDSEDDNMSNINGEEIDGALTDEDSSKDIGQQEKDEKQSEGSKVAQPTPANKVVLEAFLTSLLSCVNRDMIDKAALNFCTNLNTKYTRKKLIRALFTVPRTRLDLLPFYSRLVATLAPVMPHVATDLVQLLKQDFKFHIRKKDQINIESKIKNVRFIGELVKFKIFPKSEALTCLRLLLNDFVHHHIEMACNLLETCGRYLFRSIDSHHRCKLLLEQMMRKKSLLPYDSRYMTTIENAYYFANPPETQTIARHERPPMHEYIRKLLYKDLCRTNIDKILVLIRKLDWDDPDVSSYAIKCFTSIWNVRFYNIRCVANLLASLVPYQDWVIPQVIDGVLEDIRLMMEINHPKYNQRRISIMRYVGEMYNYRLIESNVVFKILYSLVTYGVYYNTPEVFSEIDPPDNLFRLRLVCQVLETCGQYCNTGGSKKKLDCFIIVFQKYFWLKKSQEFYTDEYPFPVNVEILFKDTVHALRSKFKFAENLLDANKEVERIVDELKPKLCELFPSLDVDSKVEYTDNGEDKDKRLNSIVEVDEDLDSECNLPDMDESDEDNNSDVDCEDRGSADQGVKNRSSNLTNTDEGSDTEGEKERITVDERSMPPKLVECPEDDLFRKEFDRIMSESLISRGQEATRGTLNDIVIPMNKLVAAKKSVAFSDLGPASSRDEESVDKWNNSETLNLMVMTRAKGNKPLLKPVQVPIDSDLALSLKQKEEAERAEKQQVKKLTLHINERREMEETLTDKNNSMLVLNYNRDSRRKYQHPKGAPDIDLIFGNK